ncbi:MAG: hypothetical protein U5K43_09160 [Halofilum sp. (in: g-proteobacteria)]|nr:hypothetical protein [Halofilum sp. (in: g-proteobacteria)]
MVEFFDAPARAAAARAALRAHVAADHVVYWGAHIDADAPAADAGANHSD